MGIGQPDRPIDDKSVFIPAWCKRYGYAPDTALVGAAQQIALRIPLIETAAQGDTPCGWGVVGESDAAFEKYGAAYVRGTADRKQQDQYACGRFAQIVRDLQNPVFRAGFVLIIPNLRGYGS